MQVLLRVYQETVAEAKQKFTPGELKMMLDISNATYLASGLMGDQMLPNIEDAFAPYRATAPEPGRVDVDYEEKWGIEAEALIEKLRALTEWQRGCLEIWANECWYGGGAGDVDIEDYISKAPNISGDIERAQQLLQKSIDLMKKSRDAVRSKTIADARAHVEQAQAILASL